MATLENNIESVWNKVLERYNYPLLSNAPGYNTDMPLPTAMFDFLTNSITVHPKFIAELMAKGLSEEEALTGILMHEVGHYMVNPRDLTRAVKQTEAVDTLFKDEPIDIRKFIINYFSDCAVNLERMKYGDSGKELRRVYAAFKGVGDGVYDLLGAFIQNRLPDFEFESDAKIAAKYKQKIEELCKIDFYDARCESGWLLMFGNVILDLLKKEKPKCPPGQISSKGKDKTSESNGSAEGESSESKETNNPIADYDPYEIIRKMDREQIDKVLNDIAKEHDIGTYERIKKYLEKQTGKNLGQSPAQQSHSRGIGLESAPISWNDPCRDFYLRKAAGHGIYIIKKPMADDAKESYPLDNTKYKVEDPVHLLNPFSTPWILPGITARSKIVKGRSLDKKFKTPHLMISIDSSGSMPHPRTMSYAVLGGHIIALNYHANGSMVGVHNFSTDSFLLFPTRDIMMVSKALCAYHGGGTVYDVEKVKQYFELMSKAHVFEKKGIEGIVLSTHEDYEKLISSIDPARKKEFEKKELTVKIDDTLKRAYEQLDHVLITDGEIFNISEIVDYFNPIADLTRHTIIVVNNPACAEKWANLGLKNTQVIPANSDADLCNISIGKVKELIPKE